MLCGCYADQAYEVLGVLPESVEFLCKKCGSPRDRELLLEAVAEYVQDSLAKVSTLVGGARGVIGYDHGEGGFMMN